MDGTFAGNRRLEDSVEKEREDLEKTRPDTRPPVADRWAGAMSWAGSPSLPMD